MSSQFHLLHPGEKGRHIGTGGAEGGPGAGEGGPGSMGLTGQANELSL